MAVRERILHSTVMGSWSNPCHSSSMPTGTGSSRNSQTIFMSVDGYTTANVSITLSGFLCDVGV